MIVILLYIHILTIINHQYNIDMKHSKEEEAAADNYIKTSNMNLASIFQEYTYFLSL